MRSREELEDFLEEIEPEEIPEAIEILEKRYDAWHDWLSMPST